MQPIVTDRVAWSVGQSITVLSPTIMTQPIEVPFGMRTRVSPRNHTLDGVQIAPNMQFLGEQACPMTLRELCKNG